MIMFIRTYPRINLHFAVLYSVLHYFTVFYIVLHYFTFLWCFYIVLHFFTFFYILFYIFLHSVLHYFTFLHSVLHFFTSRFYSFLHIGFIFSIVGFIFFKYLRLSKFNKIIGTAEPQNKK